ncbi:MAG: hypothetical protein U0414_41325 [Polyangiaceae bacterium]
MRLPGPEIRRQVFAYLAIAIVVGAVVSPALSSLPKDGFPLSSYPMFSSKRGRDATLHHVVAELESGERVILGPEFLGTGEVLQAETTLVRAIRSGADRQAALCREIAARVARAPQLRGARRVLLTKIRIDTIDWFKDSKRATSSETVIAECPIPAGAP